MPPVHRSRQPTQNFYLARCEGDKYWREINCSEPLTTKMSIVRTVSQCVQSSVERDSPHCCSACIRWTHCRHGDLWTPDEAQSVQPSICCSHWFNIMATEPILLKEAVLPVTLDSAQGLCPPCPSLFSSVFSKLPGGGNCCLGGRQGCNISDELMQTWPGGKG